MMLGRGLKQQNLDDMDSEYKQGSTDANIANISRDILEMKNAIKDSNSTLKEHNQSDVQNFGQLSTKADDAKEAARVAADIGKEAHILSVANRETLVDIQNQIKTLVELQNRTAFQVFKIYVIAGTIGAIAGFLTPFIARYFNK